MAEEEDPPEAPPAEREKVTASLRTLVEHVCTVRFGALPADVAEVLAQEVDVGRLARWYIAAGSASADELWTMMRTPRPS